MAFVIAAMAAAAAAQSATPQWTPLNRAQGTATQSTHAMPAATQQTEPVPQIVARANSDAELITNDTVISLVKAGLGPETVVAKINATRGTYDTSTDALIRLKQAGVPDPVIAAMLNRSKSPVLAGGVADNGNPDPMVPHSPGIYILDPRGSGRMMHIDPTVSNQTKTSNILGYAFTYGLSSAKLKTVIPNATARVQATDRRPTFYFYFNQSGPLASLSDFNMNFSAASTSPSEFSLVRFDQKKDHREAAVASLGFASAKMGVSDKARVAFNYESVAPGVYKVTPNADLPPGEYGFVTSMGAGTGMVARIFDFSVS
ncbi:MAG TPA: hypothetical protein VHS33_06490 [Sphingomicrobium sp.]|jgi:hypothetical protein|nr:hypothetical protein [Sphingomicrobium sp.]